MVEALHLADSRLNFPIPPKLEKLLSNCLIVNATQRPNIAEVLSSSELSGSNFTIPSESPFTCLDDVFRHCSRIRRLTVQNLREMKEYVANNQDWMERPIRERPIEEVYVLWRLAGSSVENILKRKGLIKARPPIKSLPDVAIEECDIFGQEAGRHSLVDLTETPLSMKNLDERLESVDPELFYPSLEVRYQELQKSSGVAIERSGSGSGSANLPTLVKERDIEHQLERMLIFESLVNAYPFRVDALWREARLDIAPLYRNYVWAALLNVKSDVDRVYEAIDKESPTPTDRQVGAEKDELYMHWFET